MTNIILEAYQEAGKGVIPTTRRFTYDFDFGVTGRFNPASIKRSTGTEWNIKFVGTSPHPSYKWRKRATIKITLIGNMYVTDLQTLQDTLLFTAQRIEGRGIVYLIKNATNLGISDISEFWVFSGNLEWTTLDKGHWVGGVFIPLCQYTLEGQLIYKTP